MSIIYTMILKNWKTILCEYTEFSGNFQQISMLLLKNIDKDQNYICIPYDSFYFFYVRFRNPKLSIMCLSDINNSRHEMIFEFLDSVSEKFLTNVTEEQIDQSLAYSFKDFVEVLKKEKKFFKKKYELENRKGTFASCDSGFTYYTENLLDNRYKLIVSKTIDNDLDKNAQLLKTRKKRKCSRKLKIFFTILIIVCLIVGISILVIYF